MKSYRIDVELTSPLITPLHSDTIWGHLCWALKYLHGEQALIDLLKGYDTGCPLLVSNGFPRGFVPKPICQLMSSQEAAKLIEEKAGTGQKNTVSGLLKIKALRKLKYIPLALLESIADAYTEKTMLSRIWDFGETHAGSTPETELVAHNSINRITNTVLEQGGFFLHEETFYPKGACFTIYLKTSMFSTNDISELWDFISRSGFGKDKSTGKGRFLIKSLEEFAFSMGPSNTVMSLSNYVPAGLIEKGSYNIITKYGKLGGDYAIGSRDVSYNPFKKPLIMFCAGSTFRLDGPRREYYGTLIGAVHDNLSIKHFGHVFPYFINVI